ncbi:MAG: DUF6485 family protein [Candidatus Omnitrophica bacterium]|nr:DUF6485 family protein [Candidatus Omnitrophota bacterium]MCM8789389.1 DUF6485 family protein [Candidatus Omnitrophota bacterium]
MKCVNKDNNIKNCSCTYISCERRGVCCECVSYHRKNGEIPGCFFSPDAEKTYNRSIEYFMCTHSKR